jgi:RNA polymerase sigma factor (sigma-70 family)
MGVSDSGISGDRAFPETSWSVIVQARDPASPSYTRQLRRLVELYWRPVYCVVRHAWTKDHDDAKDLTQDFFATVIFDRALLKTFQPERGSFRALLRAALTSFMREVVRGAARQKRGGGAAPVALDTIEDTFQPVPGAESLSPEQLFDVAWNEAVMTEALRLLERRLRAEGNGQVYQVFRRYDVDGDSADLSYAQLGAELGLTGVQVKHALIEARAAFRQIVTDVVRGYVADADDLKAEIRALFGG